MPASDSIRLGNDRCLVAMPTRNTYPSLAHKRKLGARARLFGYINDIARVRLEVNPFYEDQALSDGKGAVYYAVDTNVIKLFLEPNVVGPLTGPGEGYSVVFFDDDPETSSALAAALSRYIFWKLTPSRPLLLLIGHDAEARGLFDAIARDARLEMAKLRSGREELKTILTELRGKLTVEEQIKYLEDHAHSLLAHLFYQTDAAAVLNRFSILMGSSRLTRLCTAIHRPKFFAAGSSSELKSAFAKPEILHDQIEESTYRLKWKERLLDVNRRASLKEITLRADYAALARLELINQRLSSTNSRLVLITGDRKILEAGRRYIPFGRRGKSFAELFLRHPRAFLLSPEVMGPAGASSTKSPAKRLASTGAWLDTLLAKYTNEKGVLQDELRKITAREAKSRVALRRAVNNALRKDRNAADAVRSQWLEHTRGLRAAHAVASKLAREEIQELIGAALAGELDEALDNVDLALANARENTWGLFFSSVMKTGYDLLGGPDVHYAPPRRNIPPLDFSEWRGTDRLLHRLATISSLSGLQRDEFISLLAEVERKSKTRYALSLAYALLFAKAGRWHVALLIAERAIEIAEEVRARIATNKTPNARLSREEKSMTGREAYYFAAVCHRLHAQDEAGLQEAESYYKKGIEALELDCVQNPAANLGRARFFAENHGLLLSRCMFKELLPRRSANIYVPMSAREIIDVIRNDLPAASDISKLWVRRYVERAMYNHLFMAAALAESARTLDESAIVFLRSAATLYRDNLIGENKLLGGVFPITFPIRCTYNYAQVRYRDDLSRRERRDINDSDRIARNILREEPERALLIAYDKQRFNLLLNLTEKALSESKDQSTKRSPKKLVLKRRWRAAIAT